MSEKISLDSSELSRLITSVYMETQHIRMQIVSHKSGKIEK